MSQLLDCGHSEAGNYPIGMVLDEHQLIVERINRHHGTNAIMMRAVMAEAISAFGKNGSTATKALNDKIKEMFDNGAEE